MSLGIGLGAFMDGVEGGMNMRTKSDTIKRDREHRAAVSEINKDTKLAFSEAVDAGTVSPEQYGEFWKKYAMPKIKMQMIEAGDYGGAQKFEEWGLSDAALEGGRLSAQALLQAQMGDGDGAIQTGIKASQVQGYMKHGMQLVSQTPVMDKDDHTKQVGTNFVIKSADGKETTQFIKKGDEGRVISMIVNPANAYSTQVAAEKAAAEKKEKQAETQQKRADDLQDYTDKKRVDKALGVGKDPDFEAKYANASKTLMENDFNFSKLPEAERDAQIRAQLNAGEAYSSDRKGDRAAGLGLTGTPSSSGQAAKSDRLPPKRVVVDKSTGKIIENPQSAPDPKTKLDPNKKAIGLGL